MMEKPDREPMTTPNATFTYSEYLVCFLDVLGQREQLRSLRGVPQTPEELTETLTVLKKSAGSVLALREAFSDYFAGYQQIGSLLDAAPPRIREQMTITGAPQPQWTAFSDSLIITVSLANDHYGLEPVVAVNAALLAICNLFPYFFARHIPIRAGVDVGTMLAFSGNDLYGPGLERAHCLESRQARHPRVCVGHELVAYLDAIASQPETHISASVARRVASTARGLIAEDDDGALILDYLGERAFRLAPEEMTVEIIQRAHDWVQAETARLTSANDEKLAPRYKRLSGYFARNVERWLAPSR